MKEQLNSAEFADMILCAAAALNKNKQSINELNVFPVPDGDTGTNMSMTMGTAADALRRKTPGSVGAVADVTASALLRGARGNSGVILSLLFRGMARKLKGLKRANALEFALALSEGVDAAYKAVMKPAEGTILTVSKEAAAAATEFARTGTDVELTILCALEAAQDALAKTVEQNPVLARAGVIDAGGKGYVIILEAMLASLRGEISPETVSPEETETMDVHDHADFSDFGTEEINFAYDTVFIVRRTDDKPLDLLRAYLDSIGDSLVIGEDDEAFKVHVHTNTPGDALNEAQKYGILETAKIENMRTQHDDLVRAAAESEAAEPAPAPEPEPDEPVAPEKPIGIVTVCAGEGMRSLFLELGADRVVTGGQTMNPSTEDILHEIERTPAETVFVFPNNKNIILAAEQCVGLSEDRKVVVVPTKTVPQGVAAMLSLDPEADAAVLEEDFAAAAARVHTALVTYAARDSDFDGHAIHAGEYLALLDGALLGSYPEFSAVTEAVTSALDAFAPEFLSIYCGEDATEEHTEGFRNSLTDFFPEAELSVVEGGQPVYSYMISAE
ncbi:MAG: DAK2 domain-containing protein [Eubacteriales bacterium]|nr:DAK2 domain-containing protein [Eubacteriales bacterium]